MNDDFNARYKRQLLLKEIGQEGQKKILNSSVLVVGAGGLGCPALLYLSAAGVGRIGLIDFDMVDLSNLQRQILFNSDMIGKAKVSEALTVLKKLNPSVIFEIHNAVLNKENVQDLFLKYDVILDGSDNFDTKYLINDAAVKFNKPWIYGAIQGFDGQVSVFNASLGPCYRCLFPKPPVAKITNCSEAGVLGVVAGLVGITQALQAIYLMVNHNPLELLIGKLWLFNALNLDTKKISIPKKQNCSVCAQSNDSIILPEVLALTCTSDIPLMQPHKLKELLNCVLIDVRELEEYQNAHIADALNFPLSTLSEREFAQTFENLTIIVYCQKGVRSLRAAKILKNKIGKTIYSLEGGYEAWLLNRVL